MGHQTIDSVRCQRRVNHGKAFAQLDELCQTTHRPGIGFAQEIDVQIRRDRQADRPDMSEDDRIGPQICKRHHCRPRHRAARAQMRLIRLKPQTGFTGLDIIDKVYPPIQVDLREFLVQIGCDFGTGQDWFKQGGSPATRTGANLDRSRPKAVEMIIATIFPAGGVRQC